jgi:hypothetical protein
MNKNDVLCTVCQQPKNELTPRKSKLLPNLMLFLCGECLKGQKEPRFAIIMAARTMGNDEVRTWIVNRRYVGDEITLKEIV